MLLLEISIFLLFCTVARAIPGNPIIEPITQFEQDEIVAFHNLQRSSVSPSAANMEAMVWNAELASVAQSWASTCVVSFNPDRASQQSSFPTVGENIHLDVFNSFAGDFQSVLAVWADGSASYNFTANSCSSGSICGFYTQMIWATSSSIGCGRWQCDSDVFYVCNYGPAGNVLPQQPYLAGPSCLLCPAERPLCVDNLCTAAPTPTSTQLPQSSTQLIQSSSTQPIQSSSTQPIQSSSTQLIQSSSTQPIQSSSTQLIQSSSTQPIQSSSTQLPQSSSTQPIQSSSTQLPQSSSTQVIQSSSVQPTPTPEMPTSTMDVTLGADPHFSVVLPTGDMLCYSIQGKKDMVFNLITNTKLIMNALFIGDKRRDEVTWIGKMGLVVPSNGSYEPGNNYLVFDAHAKMIQVGPKVNLSAESISKVTVENGKITISESSKKQKQPKVEVELMDIGIKLGVKFTSVHLDLFWHSTALQSVEGSHGLIGQFFRKGVSIDKARKILLLPNKEPVPVMRRPVWAFMEREEKDDKFCWSAMNPGYQGKKLIDFTYMDYRVHSVLSTDFGQKLGVF